MPRLNRQRAPGHGAALRRFTRTATRLAMLGWPSPSSRTTTGRARAKPPLPLPWPLQADRVTEMRGFGSNPGQLRMFVHMPATPPQPGAPLIVVLHGCRQDAASFARDAGWVALANRLGVPLLLPEQCTTNNRHRCFHWYRSGDVGRGRGEAMSIRQMVRAATARFGSDRRAVFIVGLSAGGAMAAALLAAYPTVFAAGAVVAGMPVGSAASTPMALLRMHRADPYRTRASLVAAVLAATTPALRRRWPRLSIWQGEEDRAVAAGNADLLAAQWSGVHGLGLEPDHETAPATGFRRRIWGRGGRPMVELCTIAGMGHGFPIHAAFSGGGRPGAWVLEAGVPAARHIAAFWGLEAPPGEDATPREAKRRAPVG